MQKHKEKWEEYYDIIKDFATKNNLKNTKIALDVAVQLHKGQKRKGGQPYIIHPLEVTLYLIYLGIKDDVTLAAALLHDVIEDCLKDNGESLTTVYHLSFEVVQIVNLLTKKADISEKEYYEEISKEPKAIIIKLSDRANNVSTMTGAFSKEKMESYVEETWKYIFPLCRVCKSRFPEYSKYITIIKYKIVSICETIEALLNVDYKRPFDEYAYKRTLLFIKGYAIGKNMYNTLKALSLAEELHKDQKRKSGDPFIIHPLRVCSYLISLKINSDITCAAALLHEVFKKTDITDEELIKKYGIDERVVKLVHLVSRPDDMSYDEYYRKLKKNSQALLIKLSNRANTCTLLHSYTFLEKLAYLKEDEKYIVPLCKYGLEHFKKYSNQISSMEYHISSLCHIVKCFTIGDEDLKDTILY